MDSTRPNFQSQLSYMNRYHKKLHKVPDSSAYTTNYRSSMTPTVDLPNGSESKTNFVIRSNSDEYESNNNSMETKEVVIIK